jgi:hypothetical protein
MTKRRTAGIWALALGALLAFSGCAPSDPLEEVLSTRARYSARLNGFYVTAEPAAVDPMMDEGEEMAAEPSAEAEEGEEMAVEEIPAPMRQDVVLDIIVQHDSNTRLPGITLDIMMVDAAQQEKARWLHWVDTSNLAKANQLQFTHTLEDVPYVEGDGFAAEVRSPVPEAERGDYREFSVGG